ncbi:MAG: carboxypeptidase regulatory-like domain-containing protein [bacterium]
MKAQQGFTLIELLIATFIIGTTLTGVFGLFVLTLRTAQEGERRVAAVALANERVEMVRNLPYVDVGTVGGVPAGSIPQEEEVVRNGVTYTVRTDIRYIDDPFDGQVLDGGSGQEKITICHKPGTSSERTMEVPAAALDAHLAHGDTTGTCDTGGEGSLPGDEINTDYKQVRVEVNWNHPNSIRSVVFITQVVPQGMEGGELGGTLDFQALNVQGAGVEGATVRIVNDATNPAIDMTTETNAEGRLVLPGLPESADSYELAVSFPGYTSEQTYDATASFYPDNDHSHLSMIVRELTSKTFVIDQVSSLSVTTQDDETGAPLSVAYSFRGTRTIGVDGNGDSVYVLDDAGQTDEMGQASYENLVWDRYDFSIDGAATGYDIKETSLLLPLTVNPGEVLDMTVKLVPYTLFSLHVTVISPDGLPVDNATVNLEGQGYNEGEGTGILGQVFFDSLPGNGDYDLTVNAPGFQESAQVVAVENSDRVWVELTPNE